MRFFFLLLLLGNIAFFTWHFQLGAYSKMDASAEVFARTDPGVAELVMLSERAQRETTLAQLTERPPEPGAPPAAAPVPTPAPAPLPAPAPVRPASPPAPASPARILERCIVAGPYESMEVAEDARRTAVQAGIHAEIEETGRQVPAGFWVLLEGRYTAAEARRIRREMDDKGLQDIAITPLEDGTHAISLGIYSRQTTLEDRRREIIAQGYVPVVRERTRTEIAYSLRLALKAEDLRPMTRLITSLVDMDPRIEWRDVDCR